MPESRGLSCPAFWVTAHVAVFLGPSVFRVPAVFSQAGGQLGGGSCEVGEPSLCSHGGSWGPRDLCVLGAMGLSLTPLTPSLELEGVWPAASCCGPCVWPGSSLPCCSASTGSWQAALPRECLPLYLRMGGLGALELVRGEVGSLVACGVAQGSLLPRKPWFFRGWQSVLSGRGVTALFLVRMGRRGLAVTRMNLSEYSSSSPAKPLLSKDMFSVGPWLCWRACAGWCPAQDGRTPAWRREGLQPGQRGPRAASLASRALPAPHEAFPEARGRHGSTGQGEERDLPSGQESACLRLRELWGQGPSVGCPTMGPARWTSRRAGT